uniref:DNA binding protein n=1 Tax=Dulem virus 117 TaxID=3145594 RepID=A0AAU8B2I3_9VIRU
MRKKMKSRKDKRVFSKTASKTRKINVNSAPMRGGIRL